MTEPQSSESAAKEARIEEALTNDPGVDLTDTAASKVKDLIAMDSRTELRLRIVVKPGGCSGLSYQMFLDDRRIEGDVISTFAVSVAPAEEPSESNPSGAAVEIIIDHESIPYLSNAKIDYTKNSEHEGFTIDNPNATSSCACGDSLH
ncbi:HesB/IscA family protein [Streptomyces sp. NPDC008061]|uniref:HesB/IscA family protein n=1 Tax=Streptomyces sp. NPDC008061 TaxID=3364805 RepID=UPI0036E114AD